MKLTPFAKLFVTLVVLGVVGYAVWHYNGGDVREVGDGRARPTASDRRRQAPASTRRLRRAQATRRPIRSAARASTGVASAALGGGGKLGRPLVVGINTWAGHAPGIVANGGLDADAARRSYKKKYGLDVKFVLLEDPAAKLAAFSKGDVDIMWDTVDNWAREASIAGRAEPEGQVDHHAGLVARRRRHRLARDASSRSRT